MMKMPVSNILFEKPLQNAKTKAGIPTGAKQSVLKELWKEIGVPMHRIRDDMTILQRPLFTFDLLKVDRHLPRPLVHKEELQLL